MGGFLLDLLEFVVLVLFLIGLARKVRSLFNSSGIHVRTSSRPARSSSASVQHRGEMVRDPVCGIFVAAELAQTLRRGGNTIHFCSRECLEKYQKDAEHAAS